MDRTNKLITHIYSDLLPIVVRQTVQAKVGYIAIYDSGDCFGRTLADYPILYEDRQDCMTDAKEEEGFITVAKVTWEEKA